MYIYVVVEGQTEERFIKDVLSPFLENYGKFLHPFILKTSKGHKGGFTTYKHLKKDVTHLLKMSNICVTTMIDYYGLPNDFPGISSVPSGNVYHKIDYLELQLQNDINSSRFIPYIQVHEFEALLFSDVTKFVPKVSKQLQKVLNQFQNPEEINNSPNTAPSKRIENAYKEAGLVYNKLIGVDIIKDIGLQTIMSKCSHFSSWVNKLISLGDCK